MKLLAITVAAVYLLGVVMARAFGAAWFNAFTWPVARLLASTPKGTIASP